MASAGIQLEAARNIRYGGPVPGRYGWVKVDRHSRSGGRPSEDGECEQPAVWLGEDGAQTATLISALDLGAVGASSSSSAPAGPATPMSSSGAFLWENPFGTNGIFARVAEYIPFVNGGLQRLHEFNGDEQALVRARRQNPIGPDGYITQVAEHIPLMNQVVQEMHRTTGEAEAFERARDRNPIGTNGLVTKVAEHIPLVSDGVMILHQLQGDDIAAERARAHTLQKLLSKDGAITRLAELLPVSNLFAAVVHEVNGNRAEAIRALDLVESWAQALQADGPFAKVAELLPGADALAFAMHVQNGYYAHAIRSITKTAWVNVEVGQVVLYVSCTDLAHLLAKDLEAINLEIIPRQLSLLVAMSDMLTNFLRIDREGHQRVFRTVVDIERFNATGPNTMELTKELLKAIIDEKMSRRIECFTAQVPAYAKWLVGVLNRWIPIWRKRRSMLWLLSPRSLPIMPPLLEEEFQKAVPSVKVCAEVFQPVEAIRLRRRHRWACLAEVATASSCLAAAGCCGLGAKAAGLACGAGLLACAVQLGRAATRLVMSWLNEWNAKCWANTTANPQPKQQGEEECECSQCGRPVAAVSGGDRAAAAAAASAAAAAAGGEAAKHCSEAGPAATATPRGVLLELAPADTARLAGLMRAYYLDDALRGGPGAWLLRLAEPALHAFMRSAVETEGSAAPVVFEVELDEWEMELEGYSWNLRFPSMRLAVLLHLSLDGGAPRCRRACIVLPDALLQRLVQSLRQQAVGWDLRELDPRFSGFTQPVHVAFDLEAKWTSPSVLRLDALGLRSRLDLPD
mmetsp:Transcript_106722/g.297031  ORF Transcript_106722/g.297031 Transcript_106722/m.297031 type:complete len:799 (+) Transcript_106722:60-2456(+)